MPFYNDLPWALYLWNILFLSRIIFIFIIYRFTSIKIEGAIVCLSVVINMASLGNVSADEFTLVFSLMSRMRCYVLNILLSSPAGSVFLQCCLVRYNSFFVASDTKYHQTTL